MKCAAYELCVQSTVSFPEEYKLLYEIEIVSKMVTVSMYSLSQITAHKMLKKYNFAEIP